MEGVTICCVTYNQAQWITEALDSFLEQTTSFHYIILVYDDASTDNTSDVLQEYIFRFPDKIKYIKSSKNHFSEMGIQHMYRYIFPLITTKYVAFCDGDDYWIDPLKLQKQYDFLESHKAYGACYAQTKRYYEDTGNFGGLQGSEVNSFEMLLEECTITWQTFFMRNHLLQEYIQVIKPEVLHTDWCVQDYPLELYTMKSSKIYFMEEPMAVFRIYKNSVTHQTNLPRLLHYATGILNIISYYSENINAEKADRIKAKYTSYFMGILIQDKHTRKVGRNLKLFMRVGGIYYVDAFLLLLASSLFWFPIAVRGLYFIKRKIMPVKWR